MDINKKITPVEKEVYLLMAYKDNYDIICEILAGYKLPMLVKIAAKLDDMGWKHNKKYLEDDLKDMLKSVLIERKRRLNADFTWTDENKARFLFINEQLYEACVKGWQEATETAAALEKRIKQQDSFLVDYEIEIIINAYPKIGNGEAAETVMCHLGEETLKYMEHGISHCHYNSFIKNKFDKPITIDKSTNWNIEYFNGVFDNDYICYAIHYMLDTHAWSYPDILSIEGIWVNVEATHQNFKGIRKNIFKRG